MIQIQLKYKELMQMARQIQSRLNVTGTLVAQSPIHVGGINDNPQVDLALAVNGQGQYYIPGTSLAGAFRGWMQRFEHQNLETLWGFQEENGRGGHASFVLVEDAAIQSAVAEIRDGVGINRIWGTAAEKVKYDRAILPRGTKIPLDITLDIDSKTSNQKALLAQLLKALENGEICLGAAKTRGLGRVKLEGLNIQEHNLSERNGLLKMLQGNSTCLDLDNLLDNKLFQTSQITLEIHWQPESSVMVKAEGDGIAVDILPLVSKFDNHLTFVLPGSSIKGALRTQAERIIRTVCCYTIKDTEQDFMEQIDVLLVDDLFGVRAKANNNNKKGLGSLFVDDCYADSRINHNDWGNIQSSKNNLDLRNTLDYANLKNTQQAFHVAIDRWTGGAADGFLYSNIEPIGVNWQPIRLQLDLSRIQENQLPRIALLFLVMRDLADSRIPLGYGVNRGMGSIKVTNIVINGRQLDDSLTELKSKKLPEGKLANLDTSLLNSLNQAWKEWINQNIQEQK